MKDEQEGHEHVVGTNLKLSLLYDCMEECALVLNKHNLPHCCSNGKKFNEFLFLAKLKPKLKKKKKRNILVNNGKKTVFI